MHLSMLKIDTLKDISKQVLSWGGQTLGFEEHCKNNIQPINAAYKTAILSEPHSKYALIIKKCFQNYTPNKKKKTTKKKGGGTVCFIRASKTVSVLQSNYFAHYITTQHDLGKPCLYNVLRQA